MFERFKKKWKKNPGRRNRVALCHPEQPHGGLGWCLGCYQREHRRARERKGHVQPHPSYKTRENVARDRMLVAKYGITEKIYQSMLKRQDGRCAICRAVLKGKRRLAVDHCHKRKQVRALLCVNCNSGLGYFDDDPARLEAAATYLRLHAARPKREPML